MFTRKQQPETAQSTDTGAHKGFMAELEKWLDETVFEPIEVAIVSRDSKELHIAFSEARQQLKRKVLQSYHNGLKAKQSGNPNSYERFRNGRN